MSGVTQPLPDRVFFRDLKPLSVPVRLTDLHGPGTGELRVPHHVLWAPVSGTFDLNHRADVAFAYRAIIAEGDRNLQAALLNAPLLVEIWAELLLPRRTRDAWEKRFPELATGH